MEEMKHGVGSIGEELHNNTVLERLEICGTRIKTQEMQALVGALIPDVPSRRQPNTTLLHIGITGCSACPGGEEKWMEHLITMLRSNTSLIVLDLTHLESLKETNEDSAEYAEMLFASLWLNTSLENLVLWGCTAMKGKQMLGIIGDMLLHNHTLMEIDLGGILLDLNGDVELVYAELRTRKENTDLGLMKQLEGMERVPPNSARIFLCGSGNAGKTTLCKKWRQIFKTVKKGKMRNYAKMRNTLPKDDKGEIEGTTTPPDRTCGIEVQKMVWSDINITTWDMAGQMEYHAFHDLVLPNQYAYGGCCIYFIVCNPWKKEPQVVEDDIRYWLVFVASNTRRTKSYCPCVTILMTHHDMWGNDFIFMHLLKERVNKLRTMFQHVLDLDYGFEFIEMDNSSQLHNDAVRVKQITEEYLKEISSRIPKILKASVELQYVIVKWNESHLDKPIWDGMNFQMVYVRR